VRKFFFISEDNASRDNCLRNRCTAVGQDGRGMHSCRTLKLDLSSHNDLHINLDLWSFVFRVNACQATAIVCVPGLVFIAQAVFLSESGHTQTNTVTHEVTDATDYPTDASATRRCGKFSVLYERSCVY